MSVVTLPSVNEARKTATDAAARIGVCAALATVLVRTAWVSDDAYMTFRTVDNFVQGHGLRWNVADACRCTRTRCG